MYPTATTPSQTLNISGKLNGAQSPTQKGAWLRAKPKTINHLKKKLVSQL
jgi:hypothetical protein